MSDREKNTTSLLVKGSIDRLRGSLFITDTKARVLYGNSALSLKTGYSVAEMVGKKPSELWGGHMEKNYYENLWEAIEVRQQPFMGQIRNKRKVGDFYEEKISIAPIRNKDGEIEYFIELNPEVKDFGFEQDFQKAFQEVMSKKTLEGRRCIGWIMQWLSQGRDLSSPLDEISETANVADLLREICIEPLKAQFSQREEDKLLIYEAKQSRQAFKKLYEKYKTSIYNYFLPRLKYDYSTASDLTQETFLQALKYLDSFYPSNASYLTYLSRIAHNILINHYRSHVTRSLERKAFSPQTEESEYEAIMVRESLDKALQGLTVLEKKIIIMKYKDDLSVREMAHFLQKTENAIKLHLTRARKKLKILISEQNF